VTTQQKEDTNRSRSWLTHTDPDRQILAGQREDRLFESEPARRSVTHGVQGFTAPAHHQHEEEHMSILNVAFGGKELFEWEGDAAAVASCC
jgi:hypothetical protein